MAKRIPRENEFEVNESLVLSDIDFPVVESENPDDKRLCTLTLFQEGPGNLKTRRFYKKPAVHKAQELSLKARKLWDGHFDDPAHRKLGRDWLATIKESDVVDDGLAKLRSRVWIAENKFWEKVKNCPDEIAVSINAIGKGHEGEVPGYKGKWTIIEDIVWVNSFDLVDKPGNAEPGASMLEEDAMPEDDNKESENKLEYKDITLTALREERKDIVDAIEKEAKDGLVTEQAATMEKEAALQENKDLKEENDKLKLEVDGYQTKEKVKAKKELCAKLLKESEIPEDYISEEFTKWLDKCKDEAEIKALLEDRKKLIEGDKGKVKDVGTEDKRLESKGDLTNRQGRLAAIEEADVFGMNEKKDKDNKPI